MKPKGGKRPGAGRPRGPAHASVKHLRATQESIIRAREAGRPLAIEDVFEYQKIADAMARKARGYIDRAGDDGGPKIWWERYFQALTLAIECAKFRARTQTPFLSAVAVANAPQPTATVKRITLKIFEQPPLLIAQQGEDEAPIDVVPDDGGQQGEAA